MKSDTTKEEKLRQNKFKKSLPSAFEKLLVQDEQVPLYPSSPFHFKPPE